MVLKMEQEEAEFISKINNELFIEHITGLESTTTVAKILMENDDHNK